MSHIDRTRVINYFAYGSNMNPERMRDRGVIFFSRKRLVLPGYSLKFNKTISIPNGGAANIVPDKNGIVEGVLYTITVKGILNLDQFEHYPHEYDRVLLEVPNHKGSHLEVKTYVAHPHKTKDNLKPRKEYLNHLLAAQDILSENYFDQLKIVETLD